MRVSLAWIGIVLLTTVLVLFAVQAYMLYVEEPTKPEDDEGFQDARPESNDIHLTACPAETTSYIDNNGMNLCCKTALVNGTCPGGQLACTLSEGSAAIPTCSAYVAAVLDEKGKERCPGSRPRYYENGLIRGCTAGRRTPDGKGPATSTDPQCMLYSSEKDDLSKLDSCTNQRLLEKTVCFPGYNVGAVTALSSFGDVPAVVSCSYKDPTTHMPRMCYSDESIYRYMADLVKRGWASKDWRSQWGPDSKAYFSSKHKKVYLDKTKTIADLATDPIA